MLKNFRYDTLYMQMAQLVGEMSHDGQYKVGSVIVKDGQVLSHGWNGTPTGMPNETRDGMGRTFPHVIHSEANALMKLAKHGGSCNGATIYCTYSPCWGCAKLILQSGIVRIVYDRIYDNEAIEFMKERIAHERLPASCRIPTRENKENKYQQS